MIKKFLIIMLLNTMVALSLDAMHQTGVSRNKITEDQYMHYEVFLIDNFCDHLEIIKNDISERRDKAKLKRVKDINFIIDLVNFIRNDARLSDSVNSKLEELMRG